jgi:hypothetical protein
MGDTQSVPKHPKSNHPYSILIHWLQTTGFKLKIEEFRTQFLEKSAGIDFSQPDAESHQTALGIMLLLQQYVNNIAYIQCVLDNYPILVNVPIQPQTSGTPSPLKSKPPLVFACESTQNPHLINLLLDIGACTMIYDKRHQTPLYAIVNNWSEVPIWLVIKLLNQLQVEIDKMIAQKKLTKLSNYKFDHDPDPPLEVVSIDQYILTTTLGTMNNVLSEALVRKHPSELFNVLFSYVFMNINTTIPFLHYKTTLLHIFGDLCSFAKQEQAVLRFLFMGFNRPVPKVTRRFQNQYRFLCLYYNTLRLPQFQIYPTVLSSLLYHYNPFVKLFFRLGLESLPLSLEHEVLFKEVLFHTHQIRNLITLIQYLPSNSQQEAIFSKVLNKFKKFLAPFERLHNINTDMNPSSIEFIHPFTGKNSHLIFELTKFKNEWDTSDDVHSWKIFKGKQAIPSSNLTILDIYNLLQNGINEWEFVEELKAQFSPIKIDHEMSSISSLRDHFHNLPPEYSLLTEFQFTALTTSQPSPDDRKSTSSHQTQLNDTLSSNELSIVQLRLKRDHNVDHSLDTLQVFDCDHVPISDLDEIYETILVDHLVYSYSQIWNAWLLYFRTFPFFSHFTETSINNSTLPAMMLKKDLFLETFFERFFPQTYYHTITKLPNMPMKKHLGEIGVFSILYEQFYNWDPITTTAGTLPFLSSNGAPLIPLSTLDQISIITSGIIFRQPFELYSPSTNDQYNTYLTSLYQSLHGSSTEGKNTNQQITYLDPQNIQQPGETLNFNHTLIPGLIWWVLLHSSPQLDDIVTLLTHCRCDILNHHRQSTLMIAIAKKWPLSTLMTLARKMVNINLTDVWGRNVLHYYFMTGAYYDMPEFLDFLVIECGVIVNSIDSFGHSPLSYAIYTFAQHDIIVKLIDYTLTRFPAQYQYYYQYYEPLTFHLFPPTHSSIYPSPFFASSGDILPVSDPALSKIFNHDVDYYPVADKIIIPKYDPTSHSNPLKSSDRVILCEEFMDYVNGEGSGVDKPSMGNIVDQLSTNTIDFMFKPQITSEKTNFILNFPFGVNYLTKSCYSNDNLHDFFVGTVNQTLTRFRLPELPKTTQQLIPTLCQRLNKDLCPSDLQNRKYNDSSILPSNILLSLYAIMVRLHYPPKTLIHLINRIYFGSIASQVPVDILQTETTISNSVKPIITSLLTTRFIEAVHDFEDHVEQDKGITFEGPGVFLGWNRGQLDPHPKIQSVYGIDLFKLVKFPANYSAGFRPSNVSITGSYLKQWAKQYNNSIITSLEKSHQNILDEWVTVLGRANKIVCLTDTLTG